MVYMFPIRIFFTFLQFSFVYSLHLCPQTLDIIQRENSEGRTTFLVNFPSNLPPVSYSHAPHFFFVCFCLSCTLCMCTPFMQCLTAPCTIIRPRGVPANSKFRASRTDITVNLVHLLFWYIVSHFIL